MRSKAEILADLMGRRKTLVLGSSPLIGIGAARAYRVRRGFELEPIRRLIISRDPITLQEVEAAVPARELAEGEVICLEDGKGKRYFYVKSLSPRVEFLSLRKKDARRVLRWGV